MRAIFEGNQIKLQRRMINYCNVNSNRMLLRYLRKIVLGTRNRQSRRYTQSGIKLAISQQSHFERTSLWQPETILKNLQIQICNKILLSYLKGYHLPQDPSWFLSRHVRIIRHLLVHMKWNVWPFDHWLLTFDSIDHWPLTVELTIDWETGSDFTFDSFLCLRNQHLLVHFGNLELILESKQLGNVAHKFFKVQNLHQEGKKDCIQSWELWTSWAKIPRSSCIG